jgi:hypothetical protein
MRTEEHRIQHPVTLLRTLIALALIAVLFDLSGCRAHVQPRSGWPQYATGGVCDPCGGVK